MKKVLSLLSLIAIFSISAPAYAAPPPPPGHGAPPPGQILHAGPGRVRRPPVGWGAPPPPPPPRYHGGSAIIGGVLARRSCWGYPYCDYRVGLYDWYPPPAYYGSGVYLNVGIPIRF